MYPQVSPGGPGDTVPEAPWSVFLLSLEHEWVEHVFARWRLEEEEEVKEEVEVEEEEKEEVKEEMREKERALYFIVVVFLIMLWFRSLILSTSILLFPSTASISLHLLIPILSSPLLPSRRFPFFPFISLWPDCYMKRSLPHPLTSLPSYPRIPSNLLHPSPSNDPHFLIPTPPPSRFTPSLPLTPWNLPLPLTLTSLHLPSRPSLSPYTRRSPSSLNSPVQSPVL